MAETKKQQPPARSHIESALYDLTQGLPQRELKLMVTEAAECEEQLQADIVALEQALQGTNGTSKETDLELLDNPYTPLDSYWTASALLGRLRSSDTLACSPLVERPDEQLAPNVVLSSKMAYSLPQTVTQLLTVFKKIASNKTSIVFKRAVKPEEGASSSFFVHCHSLSLPFHSPRHHNSTTYVINSTGIHGPHQISHGPQPHSETDCGAARDDSETIARFRQTHCPQLRQVQWTGIRLWSRGTRI